MKIVIRPNPGKISPVSGINHSSKVEGHATFIALARMFQLGQRVEHGVPIVEIRIVDFGQNKSGKNLIDRRKMATITRGDKTD